MRRTYSLGFMAAIVTGVLYACTLLSTPEASNAKLIENAPALQLTVQPQSGTFNAAGQVITYQYVVTNSGGTVLPGPVTVTDNKVIPVNCPAVNSVGNQNDNFDPAESLICTGTYTIIQADLNNGSVGSSATASAGGVNSNTVNTTVKMTLATTLELASLANPTTYNQAGQVITFTYTVKNTGTATLGPAQFVIHDERLGNVNCGGADTTLTTGQAFTCTAAYTTSENDRATDKLVFNAVVSGGGATVVQPVSVTVTNTTVASSTSTSLTPGKTIQHQVNEGEWMIQIARCYGADFYAVRNANLQVIDANKIWPVNVLTIPNIGSNGKIYGPPCVTYYTAQSGDTWSSIAQKFNADLAVLEEANKSVALGAGVKLKIPLNSAGGNPVPPQPQTDQPTRINLPSGSNTVSIAGTITSAKPKVRYVLTASQGQTLNLAITAPGAVLQMAVLSVGGTTLKAQDANLAWNGTIPTSGDYYIDIYNLSAADKLYTMDVGLTTPTSAVERVADINTGAADSSPSYLTVFNGVLYFNASGNGNNGTELWKFDSTANSISLTKDIRPGADGSNPSYLAVFDNFLYFSANGGDGAGNELWRFNGTDAGRLADINSGAGDSNPSYLTVYNGLLYFSAKGSDGAGTELWQTNGQSFARVADIYSGAGDSNPSYLTVFNNALYFSATSNDGAGVELWKYDGNTISRVTDINPGIGNANPAFLTVFNNVLYFSASSGDTAGVEIWKYDGTTASRVADINATGDSIPMYLTVFNGTLYFSANGNDGAGFELWKFNGTNASRVADINKSGDSFPSFLAVYNNQLYFQANGGDGTGKELWRFKGP